MLLQFSYTAGNVFLMNFPVTPLFLQVFSSLQLSIQSEYFLRFQYNDGEIHGSSWVLCHVLCLPEVISSLPTAHIAISWGCFTQHHGIRVLVSKRSLLPQEGLEQTGCSLSGLRTKKQSCVFPFLHISVDLPSSIVFVNSSSYLPPLNTMLFCVSDFPQMDPLLLQSSKPRASSIISPYPHLHPHCSHTTNPCLFSCILCLCFRFLYLHMRCCAWQAVPWQCHCLMSQDHSELVGAPGPYPDTAYTVFQAAQGQTCTAFPTGQLCSMT